MKRHPLRGVLKFVGACATGLILIALTASLKWEALWVGADGAIALGGGAFAIVRGDLFAVQRGTISISATDPSAFWRCGFIPRVESLSPVFEDTDLVNRIYIS